MGQECQSCKKILEEDSVVVVCPECGAPYHEECFLKGGKCVYEERHGTEDCFSCDPVAVLDVQICGHCGKQNSGSDGTCDFCGRQLKTEIMIFKSQQKTPPNAATPNVASDDANSEETAEKYDIDLFVRRNVNYYKRAFTKRYKFNFCAFACPTLYLFYRKMYKEGCMFFISRMGILFSTIWGLLNRWADCLQKVMPAFEKKSAIGSETSNFSPTITHLNLQVISGKWQELSNAANNSFFIFFLFWFGMSLIWGFLANGSYKNYVQRRIDILKSVPAAAKKQLLFEWGGTSTSATVLAIINAIFCTLGVILASVMHFVYF